MTLKFKEQIEREVEITLPMFVKGYCHFYKVYSEEKAIQMCDSDGMYSINQVHAGLAFNGEYKEISEKEFKQAYNRINNLLKQY